MRKRNKDIRQAIETPLLGYSVVLLSLSCFLLLLWALIILVRIVLLIDIETLARLRGSRQR